MGFKIHVLILAILFLYKLKVISGQSEVGDGGIYRIRNVGNNKVAIVHALF